MKFYNSGLCRGGLRAGERSTENQWGHSFSTQPFGPHGDSSGKNNWEPESREREHEEMRLYKLCEHRTTEVTENKYSMKVLQTHYYHY